MRTGRVRDVSGKTVCRLATPHSGAMSEATHVVSSLFVVFPAQQCAGWLHHTAVP